MADLGRKELGVPLRRPEGSGGPSGEVGGDRRGWEAFPEGWEGSGGTPKGPGGVGGPGGPLNVAGGPLNVPTGVERQSRKAGRGLKALPECWEWSEVPSGGPGGDSTPAWKGGRVREGSVCSLEGLGEVGRHPKGLVEVGRPILRAGMVRGAFPEGREGSGCTTRGSG